MEMLNLLMWPFAACLVLTGIHCYLGIHVVTRGVIFVDLALAQIAALGTTVALLFGQDIHSNAAYAVSVLFTFVGAAIFSISRLRDERIPQEAIIGIVYAVSSATAILVLDRAPHGHEAIHAMLVGSILYATGEKVLKLFLIYAAISVVHVLLLGRFMLISTNLPEARRQGLYIRFWDFVFYVTFGLVVTSSVAIAGVLLVFSYLVVPAACAMLFANRIITRLLIGWGIGFLVSVLGLCASARYDLPTGAAVGSTFGAVLLACALIYGVLSVIRPAPSPR